MKMSEMRDLIEKRFRRQLNINRALFIICLCVIVILGLMLVYTTVSKPKICTSRACIQASNMILKNIDTTVDPCENFFQFSCGSFIKEQLIPEKQSKIDIFDKLRDTLSYNIANLLAEPVTEKDIDAVKKVKHIYNSCMREERMEENGNTEILLRFVDEKLGGWPILYNETFSNNMSDIQKLIILRLLNVSPFFELGVTSNPKIPTHSVLALKQPNWLVSKEIYKDDKIVNAYKTYMFKIVSYMNSNSSDIQQEVDKVFELEKKLTMVQVNENLKRNSTFTNLTLQLVEQKLPDFSWTKLISEGIYKSFGDDLTIHVNETILVDDWSYLESAIQIYKEYNATRRRDLDNLLIWKFVKEKVGLLSKKFKNIKLDYDKVLKGTNELPSSTLTCSNYVIDFMEYAVGRVYVDKYFNGESKESAVEMIENILNEFKVILSESDWMDEESKLNALAKASSIDTKIGYPEWIKNDTYLNELYDDYKITENSGFFNDQLNITKVNVKNSFMSLRSTRSIKSWFTGPAVVNAFYSPPANQICFPAGILQAPFYDASSPQYLNYGGIGSVIGHEITHGFDDRGRRYDKNGIYFHDSESLWSNQTIENYKEKVQCIIDQYGSFKLKDLNQSLIETHALKSQGENIADNGGVKESFRAYKKWVQKNGVEAKLAGLEEYTPEQLFFINYGQVWCSKMRDEYLTTRILNGHHSPGEFRIIGPTSNLNEFAEAFKCRKGQANNPEKKCSVW